MPIRKMINLPASFGLTVALGAMLAILALRADADVVMSAATVTNGNVAEVRVRWTLDGEWHPVGGFNLYKNGKLAAAAIKPDGSKLDPNLKVISIRGNKANPPVTLASLIAKSIIPVGSKVTDNQVSPFVAGPPHEIASNEKLFTEVHDRITALSTKPGPALPQNTYRRQILKIPGMQAYVGRLKAPAAMAVEPDDTMVIRHARAALLSAALLHQQVGTALGLGYDDKDVKNGDSISYTLKSVAATGKESVQPVASAMVTVGRDTGPAPPTALLARQRDADSVSLRWRRLSPAEIKPLGVVSYRILRSIAGGPPVQVNASPVVISDIKTKDGSFIEPVAYFYDSAAKPGALKYQVVAVDMFGRESQPSAAIDLNMEEWHTPPSVASVSASLDKGGAVTVLWSAAIQKAGANVSFHVYRIDDESAGKLDATDMPPMDLLPGNVEQVQVRLPRGWTATARFVDKSAVKDHSYSYAVSSFYPNSRRESAAALSRAVPVPDTTTPMPPVGLAAEAAPGPQGSAIKLRWQDSGLKGAVYRAYRVGGSGFYVPGKLSKAIRHVAIASIKPGNVGNGKTSTKLHGTAVYSDAVPPSESSETMLAEVKIATVQDKLPRSLAQTYTYAVTTVNRWGVEGQAATVQVTVPTTIAPAPPMFREAYLEPSGPVALGLLLAPQREMVTALHVYRDSKANSVNATSASVLHVSQGKVTTTKGSAISTAVLGNRQVYHESSVRQGSPKGPLYQKAGIGKLASMGLNRTSMKIRPRPVGAKSTFTAISPAAMPPGAEIGIIQFVNGQVATTGPLKATLQGDQLTVSDTSHLSVSTTYSYTVTAENDGKILSAPSVTLTATPYKLTADPSNPLKFDLTERGVVKLAWDKKLGEAAYILYRTNTDARGFLLQRIQISGVITESSYRDINIIPGSKYLYQIRAIDTSGNLADPTPLDPKSLQERTDRTIQIPAQ